MRLLTGLRTCFWSDIAWAGRSSLDGVISGGRRRLPGGDGTRGVGLPLATAQGVENVLGSPVLAFGEPLAYLAYDRPRHPVRFQPANQLFLAYREIDALQVAFHVPPRAGGKVLPQKVHGFGLASSTRLVPTHPMIQQTRS